MSRPTSRFLILPIVCLLAAFGLVACGSDSNSDSSSSSSSDTSSTASVSSDTSSTSTGTTSTAGSGDALTELFFTTVREQIQKQGLSPEVASCVETQLRSTITQEELDQLKSGTQPPTLRQKATDAGASCAKDALSAGGGQ